MTSCSAAGLAPSVVWIDGRLTFTMKKSTGGMKPPASKTMNATHRPAGESAAMASISGAAATADGGFIRMPGR